MLSLKDLDEAEISRVYREYMIGTFPDDELLELSMILDLKKKGVCLTLGILDQEELIGYAVLYQDSGGLGLLLGQFYSILPQYREGGHTVRVNRLLTEYFSDKTAMFVEIEDPFRQEDPAEKRRMLDRMKLFEKTGLRDGGVSVRLYGVDYRLMLFPVGGEISPEKLREYYERIYLDALDQDELSRNLYFYEAADQ